MICIVRNDFRVTTIDCPVQSLSFSLCLNRHATGRTKQATLRVNYGVSLSEELIADMSLVMLGPGTEEV